MRLIQLFMNSEKKEKLRVVADTNILISALNFGGEAETFLGMASSRLFNLFISKYILWEMRVVLQNKFKWSREMIKEAETLLRETAFIVSPKHVISVIKADEADNRILECAVSAQADKLVTNNFKHLRPLGSFRGIEIMSLKEFMNKFKP